MPLDRDAATALAAAKLWLVATESPTTCGDLPYLSSALYALIPVATERVEAMTIDEHWRLYVNPRWVEASPMREVAARLAHLVWHALADHGGRARDLDVGPDTATHWQRAADATVAEVLDGAGLDHRMLLPGDHGWEPRRSAEQYFASASGLPTRVLPDPEAADERGGAQGRLGMEEGPPDTTCGSGCDGRARAYDLPPGDDVGAVDQHDAEALRRRVAVEWREHRRRPGHPARRVGSLGRSTSSNRVVPWQQVLAAAVRRGLAWVHGHTDYTYTRVSRRGRPPRAASCCPRCAVPRPRSPIVVDTSGSVDDGLLAQALGEVDGILASQAVNDGSVTVLATDAAVHGSAACVTPATLGWAVAGDGPDRRDRRRA